MKLLVPFCAVALVAGACGSDDNASNDSIAEPTATTDTPPDSAPPATEGATETPADDPSATEPSATDPPIGGGVPASGDGTATVDLADGSSYTFSIVCTLEPQESAGSTILFTVSSYDDPVNLDVTQFGEDSFSGAANISLHDSTTYDTLWEANSMFGTEVVLTLDGSTVTGSGAFMKGEEFGGEQVAGELVANC